MNRPNQLSDRDGSHARRGSRVTLGQKIIMSMPQYIMIAVVSSTGDRLRAITKGAQTSEPGIAPRYSLVALDGQLCKRMIPLSELEKERVLLWIALDDQAKVICQQLHQINLANEQYSRGFYDTFLPEPVVRIDSSKEFQEKVAEVYKAFCETS